MPAGTVDFGDRFPHELGADRQVVDRERAFVEVLNLLGQRHETEPLECRAQRGRAVDGRTPGWPGQLLSEVATPCRWLIWQPFGLRPRDVVIEGVAELRYLAGRQPGPVLTGTPPRQDGTCHENGRRAQRQACQDQPFLA